MKQESQNFLNLVLSTADQKHLTIDYAAVDAQMAARRAAMEIANPPAKIAPKVEHNRLVSQLFDLKQNCKCFEIRVNEFAGQVHQLEGRITDELKEKKKCVADGNLRGERFYEHRVELLEDELADAKLRLQGARSNNTASIRALKAFDGHERIAELRKELGL